MLTKREVLEGLAKHGHCEVFDCRTCPCNEVSFTCKFIDEVKKLGAKEMLKTLPREFDKTKVLTCVTADQAKVGQKGIFANCLASLENKYKYKHDDQLTLIEVMGAKCEYRFVNEDGAFYSLFYPIDEVEECTGKH